MGKDRGNDEWKARAAGGARKRRRHSGEEDTLAVVMGEILEKFEGRN
jgi:hypothetical protein